MEALFPEQYTYLQNFTYYLKKFMALPPLQKSMCELWVRVNNPFCGLTIVTVFYI